MCSSDLGSWIMRADGVPAKHVDFLDVLTESMEAMHRLDFEFLAETSAPVLLPMLVGCVPVTIFVWLLFYFPLMPMISKYQAARHHRRTRKFRSSQEKT